MLPGDVVRTFVGGIPAGTVLPAGNSLIVDPAECATPSKRRDLVRAVLTGRADIARKQADAMREMVRREAGAVTRLGKKARAEKMAKVQAAIVEMDAAEQYAAAAQARLEGLR